jgi:hypothetical protein
MFSRQPFGLFPAAHVIGASKLHQAAINRPSVHPGLSEWNKILNEFACYVFYSNSTSSICGNEQVEEDT